MSFSTRRGRPKQVREHEDRGTPELRAKQEAGLTREPIYLCLEKSLITPQEHWCGLHLRWLYTIRYGAPSAGSNWWRLLEESHGPREDDPLWKAAREQEYAVARQRLVAERCYEAVMRLAVYNELPCFLRPDLLRQQLDRPALAARIEAERAQFLDGMRLLALLWKSPPEPPA